MAELEISPDFTCYRQIPQSREAIRNKILPVICDEPSQLQFCCQELLAHMTMFHKKVEPLTEIFKKHAKWQERQKKSSFMKLLFLLVSWGTEHEVAFK